MVHSAIPNYIHVWNQYVLSKPSDPDFTVGEELY